MAKNQTTLYGTGQAQIFPAPIPLPFNRQPVGTDTRYPIGQQLIFGDAIYELTRVVAGVANWTLLGSGATGAISSITGDSGGAETPLLGNFNLLGTANQITVTGTANTETFHIPTTFIAPGSIASTTTITAATGLTVTAGGAAITGTTNINTTGAAVTTIGTGGTGATNIGNATGNTAVTGSLGTTTTLTAGTGLIATTGGVTVNGGDIINSHSDAGTDVTIEVTNSDNTNGASRAGVEIATGGASGGDPYLSFQISGVGASTMTMGLDNSASDLFVISNSTAIGTSNALTLSQAGALTATTTLTATLGDITATNGNLSLGTAGNKIAITTGANASLGTSAAMTAGSITISTTAVTASSIIFLTANTPGGTQGTLSAPTASIVAGTSFVINSSNAADTSTVNWWIVN